MDSLAPAGGDRVYTRRHDPARQRQGREVYIQAAYNPIFDPRGRPYKVVKSIRSIVRVIEQIDGFASSIAASVEEQAAAIRDVARNANEVALGAGDVVDTIAAVASAAKEGHGADHEQSARAGGGR